MAPSFPLVGFAESCGLHDGVTLKPMTTAIGTIFKNTAPTLLPWWEICPVAWASDSWALGPMGDSASPRLCLPASVSLACSVDTPLLLCRVLIGLRCFELLRWKRLEKQNPIIIPYKAWRGSRGWLLSYCSSRTDLLLHSALAASTGERAQSSSSQCHFRIDFPNMSYPTAQTIFPLLYESVILYRCLNAVFQLATSPVGYWL